MRSILITRLAPFLAASLAVLRLAAATPYPQLASANPVYEVANALEIRACANPCGWQGQVCCESNQYCYTDSNDQAQCGTGAATVTAAPGGGTWAYFTTTYVVAEATTVTKVYSSQMPVAANTQNVVAVTTVTVSVAVPEAAPTCNVQLGQIECGSSCCFSGQFCNAGTCVNNGATTPASGPNVTPAIRPTSESTYTVVTTGGVTTTVPFMIPASATGTSGVNGTLESTSGSSLSGGAIAGIVIGVLAGIIILILIIICCCARGLLDLFRPKRKTEVTEIIEGRHHSSGAAAGGRTGRRFPFFGGGNANVTSEKKKSSGWAGVAGILAAVALILGLKRRRDRQNEERASEAFTYSDYTYDYSSASSVSSPPRTHVTRDSRRSDRRSTSRR